MSMDFSDDWSLVDGTQGNPLKLLSDDQLLERLNQERQKFTRANDRLIDQMISELQQRNVYPQETVAGNPNTVRAMVDSYGAYWYQWRPPFFCPFCAANLQDLSTGPPFKREILIKTDVPEEHNTLCCPDCQGRFAWSWS